MTRNRQSAFQLTGDKHWDNRFLAMRIMLVAWLGRATASHANGSGTMLPARIAGTVQRLADANFPLRRNQAQAFSGYSMRLSTLATDEVRRWSRPRHSREFRGKYPPAEPGALGFEPLEAAGGVADAAP